MDQCLRYDDNGNIYPLPFGPTKTSLYANTPFCVNPVEIVFVILIGMIYSQNRLLDSPRLDSFSLKMGLENIAINTGY